MRWPLCAATSALLAVFLMTASPAVQAAGRWPMLAVPDVRQSTDYTCGPSALQAVLGYWGIEAREDELAKACLTTAENGTNRHSLIRVAQAYGLRALPKAPMSTPMLKGYLRQGYPVILAIQAWSGVSGKDYSREWDDGHYVVAIGYDQERLYVEDPSILGGRGWMTFRELDRRWHDCDAGPEDKYSRLGIVCIGKRPAGLPADLHVD
jgi:predicted double-glycine peptidase